MKRFKPSGKRRRARRRPINVLASVLTSFGLYCGIASIFAAIDSRFERAAYFILAAIVFDILDGAVAIKAQAMAIDIGDWQGCLYRSVTKTDLRKRYVTLTAVPYYAWANRGPGAMRVWIPRADS